MEVYASDGRGAASDPASAKATVADTAPTAGTVTVLPTPAATNDVVRAVANGFADIDGDTLTYEYQWFRNGTAIQGATGRTLDLAQSGNGDDGDRVEVSVIASDGHGGTSPSARGGQTIDGTNATPLAGSVAITPASPKTDQVVTASTSGFRDPDGDALTFHYTWSRNGTAIPGATSETLALSGAGNGDRGDVIEVAVTATDPQDASTDAVSDRTTVATTDPTAGTVTVRPTAPAANDTVSAVPSGFADADGDALSYRYQWSRNGEAIPGATGRSLRCARPWARAGAG